MNHVFDISGKFAREHPFALASSITSVIWYVMSILAVYIFIECYLQICVTTLALIIVYQSCQCIWTTLHDGKLFQSE